MIFRSRPFLGGFALVSLTAWAVAEDAAPSAVAPAPLSAAEVEAAAKTDQLSMPTPGELLIALNKVGKLDWKAQFRLPISTTYPSRAQMALNLGGLIADGYIAVEAEDGQMVKNIGKDILALGKNLGVSKEILDRGKSLTEFAEDKQWDVLREELEATQNEVKEAMVRNQDTDLVTLVTLGGWLRGTEVLSGWVGAHYSEAGARLLRQPAIVRFMSGALAALPEKLRTEGCVKKTQARLKDIEQAVSFPMDQVPSQEAVLQLNKLSSELVRDLAKKDSK